MLEGTYVYKKHTYYVSAYDFGDNIAMYLSPATSKDRLFLDDGITIGEDRLFPTWNELYLSIGAGNVKVSCYTEKEDGVVYKNQINREVITYLAELLRGMKSNCNKSTREDDGELYDVGFDPSKFATYVFENGVMKLDMDTILLVDYEELVGTETIKLFLEEDGSYQKKINELTKTHHKFKLDLSKFDTGSNIDDDVWDFGDDDKIFSLSEIIEKNPDKNYLWLKDRRYEIVKTIDRVEEICKIIWKHDGIVAFDVESTGLNVTVKSRVGQGDRLVGMVFSIKPGEAWYFPIMHKKVQNICTPSNEAYIIEKYFKPILENKELLTHNGAYDWKVMYNYDISINIVHDTYILFKVTMWNDHRTMSLGLKSITKLILNRDSFELHDFVMGKFGSNNVKFWDLEEESVKYYACPDTDNLIELFQYAMDKDLLGKYGARKIYEIEVQFSLVIAYQEYYGHCVDITKIDDLVKDIVASKELEYAEMVKICGRDFNPNSSKDLQQIVFKQLGYPVIEETSSGAPSTGKKSRDTWMKYKNPDGTDMYPFARHLHKWKEASTLESNFTKNIDKFASEDGLMFSEVKQFLETGRVSTKDPNYQSYSKVVKKYIVPRTGYYNMDADYSSVEARIMVSMAGCQNMVNKLKDPDADYHTLKASDMFGVPYELVTPDLRQNSKGVNFGILYGLGDPNLGVRLFGKKTATNTRKAKKMKDLYFTGMEELRSFIEYSKNQGTSQFYSTTHFERRRYFDPRKTRRDSIERQSCNARIQGTAADIYKVAMVRLFHQLRKRGLLGKLLISAFVHDECYLEVHKSLDPCKALKMLRECMMLDIEGWCPLFIGVGFGANWYQAKSTEIPVQVQDKMIDTWGESGLDWWDGDIGKLYDWEVNEINDYRRDRVISYLKNEDNWGKVLSPVENSLAHEVLSEIESGVVVHGAVNTDVKSSKDMIENLKAFCVAFGCVDLFEKADIRKPDHTKSEMSDDSSSEYDVYDIEEQSLEDILNMRLKLIGVHSVMSGEGKKVYFRYDDNNPVLMKLVYNIVKSNPGNVEVIAVKNGEMYGTGMSIDIKAYPKLLQLYMSSANAAKVG